MRAQPSEPLTPVRGQRGESIPNREQLTETSPRKAPTPTSNAHTTIKVPAPPHLRRNSSLCVLRSAFAADAALHRAAAASRLDRAVGLAVRAQQQNPSRQAWCYPQFCRLSACPIPARRANGHSQGRGQRLRASPWMGRILEPARRADESSCALRAQQKKGGASQGLKFLAIIARPPGAHTAARCRAPSKGSAHAPGSGYQQGASERATSYPTTISNSKSQI